MIVLKTLIVFLVLNMTRANIEVGETREITVSNGATTLATLVGPADGPVNLVWGHGLGSKDPELRTRFNDKSSNSSYEGMEKAQTRLVCYDARGHGSSHGWEETANQDQMQFSWSELAKDMMEVVNSYELPAGKTIVGGSSMGSATALYTALQNKDRIDGLILMRPPTAWEERLARKDQIIENARRLQLLKPDSPYYNVLYGSAYSDLPPLETLQKVLDIPVLIVTAKGDPAHPVTTAEALVNLSDDVELFIAESYSDGLNKFPDVIAEFLLRFK